MALNESALGNGAPVYKGALYVCDGAVRISPIGLNLDGTGGPAKTVADLKTLLSATTVKACDVQSRVGGVYLGPAQNKEIFEC
jgi:hypothetical protein